MVARALFGFMCLVAALAVLEAVDAITPSFGILFTGALVASAFVLMAMLAFLGRKG